MKKFKSLFLIALFLAPFNLAHSNDVYFINLKKVLNERKAGSDWVDVTDLTELRVWEYNLLVEKLDIHYPEYPIEHLEGRFV